MDNGSVIIINKDAVSKNIKFLQKKMGKNVRISSVVKANAYGHGITTLVPLIEAEGINHFSVFDYNEALQVEKCTDSNTTIMIMGWITKKDLKTAIIKGFEFFIFSIRRLKTALEYAKELNIPAKIHIEVETGMNRSGLNLNKLKEAFAIIYENKKHFEIQGFCTHLAGAESISNHVRIQKQLKRYHAMEKLLSIFDIEPVYRHVANSAASFVYPKTRMNLVRIGIMQYGYWSSPETFIHYTRNKKDKKDPLDRILCWKSEIMSIKDIEEGEFIGYGISYLAQSEMKTALIPVGYSMGYNRALSNKGRVLINGQRCGIIGVVNMNMIIADITIVPDAKIGDEVIIIGKQGDLEIKVSAFCNISNELNYEVLAHLPENIKRIVK